MITIREYISFLERNEIPPEPPDTRYDLQFKKIRDLGVFALIDKIWIKQLADWIGKRSCLEVMSGIGWLAKALFENNIDIIATDNNSWKYCNNKLVHPIEIIEGIHAVKKYGHKREILIISWPYFEDNYIIDICKLWGNKPIIYIGEDKFGCCACAEFFDHWKITEDIYFPMAQLFGIHDNVYIGRYE